MWPTFISSTTQPIRHVTGVSETLPTMSELSTNYLSVVLTTMSRVSVNVASTHTKPGLLSLGGTLRFPPQDKSVISLLVSLPFFVTMDVRSTTSQAPAWANVSTYISCKFMSPFIIHSTRFQHVAGTVPVEHLGKAPLVDPFTAEDPEIRFNDWLATLERAAVRNGWSEE